MTNKLNENTLAEQPLLDWFKELGYEVAFGPDIAPLGPFQERGSHQEVVLKGRLKRVLRRLNQQVEGLGIDVAVNALLRVADQPSLIHANKETYDMLTRGVVVEFRDDSGNQKTDLVRVIDFEKPENNEFLAVNQFSVQGAEFTRRPDVVVFVNGLPLAVFELKNPQTVHASIDSAIDQLETYKKEIPSLFAYNQMQVVSDMVQARHGTISSPREWYSEWKLVADENENRKLANLQTLTRGMFQQKRLLDIIQNFVVFEADSEENATTYTKKMCKYHQYYGVRRAVEATQKAVQQKPGERKVGVFWHTQGSGKTLSMVFFANALRNEEEMGTQTLLFLTDRVELDDQMYRTFARSGYSTIAKHMESIKELKEKLTNPGAEIIFTTIHKFDTHQELLSDKSNILVISDEAHRSQYADMAGNVRDALPNASFMGITGTPISFDNRDTRLVFGDFVSVYRIDQAEADNATVPIFYEGRLIPLNLENDQIDDELKAFLSQELSLEDEQRLKQKLSRLEAAIGSENRLEKIAADIVNHFNNRGIEGKGMVVTINRRVAVELYKKIISQPHAPETAVVVSNLHEFAGEVQEQISVSELERQFKKGTLQLAIVCDMWLTGFDVPPLHTMYFDKPLRGHTLMQAIARVNRIYKDKPAGLIVDYIGVATELKKALSLYSSDIKDADIFPLEEAIRRMQEKYVEVKGFFTGVDYSNWKKLDAGMQAEKMLEALSAVLGGNKENHDEDRVQEFFDTSEQLFKLHALVMPHVEANEIREDIEFFQAVRKMLYKFITPAPPRGPDIGKEAESAIRTLVAEAINAEDVVDIFAMKGKQRLEISIFDENFLKEVKEMRFKNLAVEMMKKLLDDEIRSRRRKNEIRFATLKDLLDDLIEKYENNVISSSEVIERLIELAKELREQEHAGDELGLSEEELAFYDAVAHGKKGMNGEVKEMVKEMVKMIRRDIAVDWTDNDVIKSRIRANVRLLLLRSGYSKDEAESMVDKIIMQASLLFGQPAIYQTGTV